MVWLFHCSNKGNCATSLFPRLFYFNFCLITAPVNKTQSLWRVPNLFFALSWFCSSWANPIFLCVFFPTRILPTQGTRSSTLLLAIPELSSGTGPIPLLWEQYTSEADFPSLTHLPPGLLLFAKGYMFGNVLISPLWAFLRELFTAWRLPGWPTSANNPGCS